MEPRNGLLSLSQVSRLQVLQEVWQTVRTLPTREVGQGINYQFSESSYIVKDRLVNLSLQLYSGCSLLSMYRTIFIFLFNKSYMYETYFYKSQSDILTYSYTLVLLFLDPTFLWQQIGRSVESNFGHLKWRIYEEFTQVNRDGCTGGGSGSKVNEYGVDDRLKGRPEGIDEYEGGHTKGTSLQNVFQMNELNERTSCRVEPIDPQILLLSWTRPGIVR